MYDRTDSPRDGPTEAAHLGDRTDSPHDGCTQAVVTRSSIDANRVKKRVGAFEFNRRHLTS